MLPNPFAERSATCSLKRATNKALNRATQLTLFTALTGAKRHFDEGTASTGYRPRPAELADHADGAATSIPAGRGLRLVPRQPATQCRTPLPLAKPAP